MQMKRLGANDFRYEKWPKVNMWTGESVRKRSWDELAASFPTL
jgi:hypothetical protein